MLRKSPEDAHGSHGDILKCERCPEGKTLHFKTDSEPEIAKVAIYKGRGIQGFTNSSSFAFSYDWSNVYDSSGDQWPDLSGNENNAVIDGTYSKINSISNKQDTMEKREFGLKLYPDQEITEENYTIYDTYKCDNNLESKTFEIAFDKTMNVSLLLVAGGGSGGKFYPS